MMQRLKLYRLFILLALLAGCAQLGLAPAQTFDERLAYAYGTHTAVQKAAASSLTAKDISSADAEQVLKLADESKALLDGARAAAKIGDTSTANGKLLLATSILSQLQTYIRSKGV
jgi:hypothetical protein